MRRADYLVLLVLFVSIVLCGIVTSCNECQENRRLVDIPANIEFISCRGITYAYIVHYEGKKYMMSTSGGILEIK